MAFINRFLGVFLLAACTAALGSAASAAGKESGPSAADLAAFNSYTLNTDFLEKWEAIAQDPNAPAAGLNVMALGGSSKQMSLDDTAAALDAKPGVHDYLASRGLTSRDYLLGTITLFSAAVADIRQKHPDMVEKGEIGGSGPAVSPANLDFYRKHKDEIHHVMQAAGRRRLQAHSGIDPDNIGTCVKLSVAGAGLAALGEPGTSAAPASARQDIAKSLADLAPTMNKLNLKNDLNDMADEIRRQAHAKQMVPTPKFSHALNDMKSWMQAECKKKAPPGPGD